MESVDEILDNLIDNYVERDGSFGLSQLTTNKHWEEVRKIAKQAIQQELLKARIDEISILRNGYGWGDALETSEYILDDRLDDLQAKLKGEE